MINLEVDNMLSPTRQAELAALSAQLATFKPTIVAIERESEAPDYVDPHYEDYSVEMLQENVNERVQLGYRLAAEVGLEVVHAIDEQTSEGDPDYFPMGAVQEHLAKMNQSRRVSRLVRERSAQHC